MENIYRLLDFTENTFITLQDKSVYSFRYIMSIEPVKIEKNDDEYFEKMGGCTLDNAKATLFVGFNIVYHPGRKLFIGYKYQTNLYTKVEQTNKFLRLFSKYKYIKNQNLNKFYSNDSEQMKQDLKNLSEIRQELILKFNQWKDR